MRNLFVISLICVLLGWGCTPSEMQNRHISLSATVGELSADSELMTKADADPSSLAAANPFTGSPAVNRPLDVAIWLSDQKGVYSNNPQAPTYLPCVTSVSYNGSASKDIWTPDGGNMLTYPLPSDETTEAAPVYCVGFYPQSNWNIEDSGTSASHIIDGSEDLMFSKQMTGSYEKNFAQQKFEHLLTWVKVNLSTTSLRAAEIWGPVEYLKVVTPNQKVDITFSDPNQIEYTGGPKDISLALPEPPEMSITTRTFGQVFCAPPEKDSEGNLGYTVKVKTANLSEKEVFVKLLKGDYTTPIESADYAVGKLFVINLRFNDIAVLEGVCTLVQWDNQNSNIYLK